MKKNQRILIMIIAGLILLGVLASATVMFKRIGIDKQARTTAIAVEWTQLRDIAARQGMSVKDTVAYLQDYNGKNLINAIVFKEPILNDLQNQGSLQIVGGYEVMQRVYVKDLQEKNPSKAELEKLASVGYNYTSVDFSQKASLDYNFILCPNQDLQYHVYNNLKIKTYAKTNMIDYNVGGGKIYGVVTTMPYVDLINLGIGFAKDDLELIKQIGLQLVIQIKSWPKVDQKAIDFVFSNFADYSVEVAGFSDPELPGYNQENWGEISKKLADKFKELDMPLLSAEFFAQKGLSAVASKMDFNVARMHPVSEAELTKFSMDKIIDRFQLATSERSMGIALVRVYNKLSLDENAAFLNKIYDAVSAKGTQLGEIGMVGGMKTQVWVVILVTLAIAAAAYALVWRLNLGRLGYAAILACLLAAIALIVLGKIGFLQKLLGLANVIIFPTLGVLLFAKQKGRTLLQAILALLGIALISLVGAILTIGVLSTSQYMTGITVFSGVKVGQALPLVILACYYWYQTAVVQNPGQNLLSVSQSWLKRPVTFGIAVLAVIALAVFAMFMLRSGNDAVAVSGLERAFRSFLDKVMLVRPRTKEFMFAYPLLLLVLYYGYRKNLWPLVVLGAISQVSLINTFQHLHTPVWVSMLRTVNGLVLGIILGVVLIAVTRACLNYWQKRT